MANLNPAEQPAVWADFGDNAQASAAFRPWMPCPGSHEIEFNNGAQGFGSYLTRYSLPNNGTPFPGLWYRFRVGFALFISLSADNVTYQDSGGTQTHWLEKTLSEATKDTTIDWIIVQMHQAALRSSKNGNGSDKGIREAWLPLFDRYGVDLVLCGHDHDRERSWPVRGCNQNVGRYAKTGTTLDT